MAFLTLDSISKKLVELRSRMPPGVNLRYDINADAIFAETVQGKRLGLVASMAQLQTGSVDLDEIFGHPERGGQST